MACPAARRCCLAAVRRLPRRTADAVFRELNWWTRATVVEALSELVADRKLRIAWNGGAIVYEARDDG